MRNRYSLKAETLIRLIVGLQLGSFFLAPQLWHGQRNLPLIPLFSFLTDLPAFVHYGLFALMCVSSVVLLARPSMKWAFGCFVAAWLSSVSADVLRLGFVSSYFFVVYLSVIYQEANDRPDDTFLSSLTALFFALYFWAGLNKLNSGYVENSVPWLLGPFLEVPRGLVGTSLAVGSAVMEAAAGVFLLFRRTRKLGVCLITVIVGTVMLLFGPFGLGFEVPLLPWNLAQLALAWLVCWTQTASCREILVPKTFAGATARFLFFLLPLLSLWGLWPDEFSFRLFSGNALEANVIVSETNAKRLDLPLEKIARRDNDGNIAIHVGYMTIMDASVQYCRARYFKELFLKLCARGTFSRDARLVINHSLHRAPLVFSGTGHEDEHLSCEDALAH